MFKRIIVLFSIVVLASCAQLNIGFKDPQISLLGASVQPVRGLEQTVKVQLSMYNPNGYTLPIQSVRYELALDGFDMIAGSTSSIGSIPANGKKTFDVSATVNLLGGIKMLNSMIKNRSKELNYKLGAVVKVDLPLAPSVNISKQGKVPLR